jgi:hypothetical protein
VSVFIGKKSDLAGLCHAGPKSLVVLQDSFGRPWYGKERLIDVLSVNLEFLGSVWIDEAHCVDVFVPGDGPVACNADLSLDF